MLKANRIERIFFEKEFSWSLILLNCLFFVGFYAKLKNYNTAEREREREDFVVYAEYNKFFGISVKFFECRFRFAESRFVV